MLTTTKTDAGVFDVLWNGLPTPYRILNGSRGVSGRDSVNTYGISKGEAVTWVGSLHSCKGILTTKLKGVIQL